MYLFILFILSLFLTIALIPVFKRMAFRVNLLDEPDPRKVHVLPMPRSGGISMALGTLVPVLLWVNVDYNIQPILVGCGIIVLFGLVDDIRNLKYTQKLMAQIAGALVVILWGGVRIHYLGNIVSTDFEIPYFFSVGLTMLFIVGVTNAINLSDGLDGLAGGISMLSFIGIAILAYRCGNMALTMMCAAVIGAILGFLRYNTHPAIIFMGDAGSQMLGFLGAVFTLMLTQCSTPYNQIMPLFLIGFPILDTLTVMVERMAKGGSPFKPDKNHFHHKLMKLGLYHSESVMTIYLLQAMFIGCAFVFRYYSNGVNLVIFSFLSGIIVLSFEVLRRKDVHFRTSRKGEPRSESILARIKARGYAIRLVFAIFRWGLYLVVIFQSFISQEVSGAVGTVAFILIVVAFLVKRLKFVSAKEMTRITIYGSIPLICYLSTFTPVSWMAPELENLNNLFLCWWLCQELLRSI
ncbi:Glycosyltransferase, group 4 family [Desulfamplus magnetovallimortis]|uniref:Glycosyltransferase, group 4 family n=1 Tax=Desulfamplus magnetovallimortis TaxID=1246637 RepID=A0A1W1HDR9_9BACT|nr:MraY family glycosyltransferase [Desulfamplus magnetovallimortis]SLM30619.1 Glycosyltransferase, group 4 family [Desulfamplus magnetovallimortis]